MSDSMIKDDQDTEYQEYDESYNAILEGVWGEGFLSPGGPEEVDSILEGLDLTDYTILDIGCGLGGADFHIAQSYKIKQITGIDIADNLVNHCKQTAIAKNLADNTSFLTVKPGPLPFDEGAMDIVFSKDSIIHIADKHSLAKDIYRVLRPGGWFAASDWLASHDGPPSSEMIAYEEAEGLDFGLAGHDTYEHALQEAGFQNIEFNNRNGWYRNQAREERSNLAGPLYEELKEKTGSAFVDQLIDIWDKMIIVLDRGELCPTHLRAQRPL
ncbi:MAG: methyltransferase domain-containing protein [Rhodospirillales bacterium]|jgi:ubiquinone/menaquinone biosynthesis C-methylase UbiE|nr:methyltransferase domain-containing protein [Rhodospirillales bacterium]